jgi:heat shock protein HslJ
MVQDQNLIGFFSQGPSYTLEGSTLTLTTPTATIVMTEQ